MTSSGNAERLRSGGEVITEIQFGTSSPELLPADGELQKYVGGIMGALNPNVMVETLSLYKKPASSHTSANSWDNAQKTGLYNQLLALSTLAGIQYYSASRGTMRTFFESSQIIDQPDKKNPLPDPVFAVPPPQLTLYARQKDLTFGDNIYRYDYTVTTGSFYFLQENITSLTIGIVPAVGAGNLKSVLAVFDCGDSLLLYAISMVRSVSVPGARERIGNSFTNRAEAVLKWFTGRANIVFGAN